MTYLWWQTGIIYQIYPRSFQDSNSDGIGDLPGITQRLDYLVNLGVDAIWISPIYPSPMADFGYDVADYCDIDPRFGTLTDFDELILAVHQRGLRLILDFVPNHTSHLHPWFIESRASRASEKRDWYIWRDAAADGGPPNNWISDFGGSAWEWDGSTRQYYYHAFLKEQPDLNWRCPEVRAALYDVLHFWFSRGVDGFRIDVLWHLIKASTFPDNPENPNFAKGMRDAHRVLQLYSTDQPEVHQIIAQLRSLADSYCARVLIGEIYLPAERLMTYYGKDRSGVHMPFNFQLIDAPWDAQHVGDIIASYEALLPAGAWPNWVLGNHDRSRVATRLGPMRSRAAAMLLLTLRGTPTLYYGEELGLSDGSIGPDLVQDPLELREPGLGFGRDPVRTPMLWNGRANAGFTNGVPWLPLNADFMIRNVEAARSDPKSIWTLYRTLIALRRAHCALTIGDYTPLPCNGDVLAYWRRSGGDRLLIAINFAHKSKRIRLPDSVASYRLVLSTFDRPLSLQDGVLHLSADEGIMLSD